MLEEIVLVGDASERDFFEKTSRDLCEKIKIFSMYIIGVPDIMERKERQKQYLEK